jgi:uncharacterized protein (UPF0332 family)
MLVQEHIQTAREFLDASDREFDNGDILQGSEKLWGAASHVVMAHAQQRDWDFHSHRSLKNAVERLAREYDDPLLASNFAVAEQFHSNIYPDSMEDFQLDADRPMVRHFVNRMLALMEDY